MATSASRTYEQQNDEQLDGLHSKLRTLRAITIDIHSDAERQNRELDGTRDYFTSFTSGLAQSSRNATRAFGGAGGTSQLRMIALAFSFFLGFWVTWKMISWWFSPSPSS